MYRIIKITDHAVVDFAAEELKKYLRMMMPEAGDIPISRAEKADPVCGFCLGVMADLGLEEAARRDPGLANGINIYDHKCTNYNVAKSLQLEYTPVADVIG